MDRLTSRNKLGLAYLINVKPDEQEVESPYPNTLRCILDCFNRLAEYEDSNLTPAEVAELAQAKADGRVVVLPVVHRGWVTTRTIIHDGELYCSLCGQEALTEYGRHTYIKSNYCPNCGAKMDKESDNNA